MFDISLTCKDTWQKASYNTMWCLIGCSIGDFGTIYYFQIIDHSLSIYVVMLLAILNGLITSIILETIILMKTFIFAEAISIAFKMSFISMISMEIAISILIMLMKLILNAILIASAKINVFIRIMVSNIMLVIKPLSIASNITTYIDKE